MHQILKERHCGIARKALEIYTERATALRQTGQTSCHKQICDLFRLLQQSLQSAARRAVMCALGIGLKKQNNLHHL